MTDALVDRAYSALSDLRDRLPHLRDALIPGTPSRRSGGVRPAAVLARMGLVVAAERDERADLAARGIKVSGDGRTPVVLSVLDSERHIVAGIARLEAQACEWLGLTPLAGATPAERICRLIRLLGRLAGHRPWIEHVADDAGRLARRAARALGDVEPVTTFNARCPKCRARSLRALPERELIVCCNGGCAPACQMPTCVCLSAGRHVWGYGDAAVALGQMRESA